MKELKKEDIKLMEITMKKNLNEQSFARKALHNVRNRAEDLGRPQKVLFNGAWRQIYWEPLILIKGKPLFLEDMFLKNTKIQKEVIKEYSNSKKRTKTMKGGRRTKE